MRTLIIETSTNKGLMACIDCSLEESRVVFCENFSCFQDQSKQLISLLIKYSQDSCLNLSTLDCIAVGVGPGSYTGMRVGVSIAQAFAFSLNLPLIELATLRGFVPLDSKESYAVMIDAKMSGVYVWIPKAESELSVKNQENPPHLYRLEDLPFVLKDIEKIVTPEKIKLQSNLEKICPEKKWIWEERWPSPLSFAKDIALSYSSKNVKKAGELQLCYFQQNSSWG